MFEFINTMTLRATFVCCGSGTLPGYLGSTVRGIMGHCIRDFFCHRGDEKCFRCEEKGSCPYALYFSNTGGDAGAVNPYVIYVHGEGKEVWEKGDACVFDITLFGLAAKHPRVYLDAIMAAEKKGWGARRISFRLIQVVDPQDGALIYANGKTWASNLRSKPLQIQERDASHAMLVFDTPLRVVSGGHLFQALEFPILIQFLIRRISLLTVKYTDYRLEWDENEILEQAERVKIAMESWREIPFARYSMNQLGGKLKLPSKTGWVLYEGELSRFVPILEAGKYLRLGKGATIGFGHYEVNYDG